MTTLHIAMWPEPFCRLRNPPLKSAAAPGLQVVTSQLREMRFVGLTCCQACSVAMARPNFLPHGLFHREPQRVGFLPRRALVSLESYSASLLYCASDTQGPVFVCSGRWAAGHPRPSESEVCPEHRQASHFPSQSGVLSHSCGFLCPPASPPLAFGTHH